MVSTREADTTIDRIVARYDELQRIYDFPREAAIFDSFKAAAAEGSIPLETELYIQSRLGYSLAEQRRLRSQYDMLNNWPKGAHGGASDRLYRRLLGSSGGTAIIRKGPLLGQVGPRSHRIQDYLAHGGYLAARKAFSQLKAEQIINEVKRSRLAGRGGAYFPVGTKWEAAARNPSEPKFLICNADEGEPPTRKDKVLMDHNPHLLLEGMLIAAKAIDAHLGIIYVRGDYAFSIERLNMAIADAVEMGWLGDSVQGSDFAFSVHVFPGSGSYVAGCDTAMLESLEGKAAIPRATPPYPAEIGLIGKPTVVNNVETLCNIPIIINKGGAEFAHVGESECTGTKIFGLCGDIAAPGMYEFPTGTPLRDIIEAAGGVIDAKSGIVRRGTLKAVSPGGITTGLLSATEAGSATMDPRSLGRYGASLGSGAIAVFNDKADLRAYAEAVMEFLAEESCGSCIQCPLVIEMTQKTLARARSEAVSHEDLDAIAYRDKILPAILKCGLGKTSHTTVRHAVEKFPDEFRSASGGAK